MATAAVALSRHSGKLAVVEREVDAARGHQDIVRTLLDDSALVHHDDGVGVADCREAVRDHETGATMTKLRHGLLDQDFSTGIDVARRLVEDEDALVRQKRARDGE